MGTGLVGLGFGMGPWLVDDGISPGPVEAEKQLANGARVVVDDRFGEGGGAGHVKVKGFLYGASGIRMTQVEFDDEPGTLWQIPQSACTLIP